MASFRQLRLLLLVALLGCNEEALRAPAAGPASTTPASPIATQEALPPRPMMIDFTKDFCLPCQVMAPWVAELRSAHAASIDVVEVNLDRQSSDKLALFFQVESVPTQVYLDASGRVVEIHAGTATREEMERSFRSWGWVR
jgi:thioredoxin 1